MERVAGEGGKAREKRSRSRSRREVRKEKTIERFLREERQVDSDLHL